MTLQVADASELSALVAVMVAVPAALPVTVPSATVAFVLSELVHTIALFVALSGLTVAVNFTVLPATTLAALWSRPTDATLILGRRLSRSSGRTPCQLRRSRTELPVRFRLGVRKR